MSKLLKNFKKKKKNEKGFTLVELIVVIVILAILIGVSIGGLYSWVGKSRNNTDINNAAAIQGALSSLAADKDVYTWANGSSPTAMVISWKDAISNSDMAKTGADKKYTTCTGLDAATIGKIQGIMVDGLPAVKAADHFTITIDPNGGNPKVTCVAWATSAETGDSAKKLEAKS